MSYTTIHQCANDASFVSRVQACVIEQAWNNIELSDTEFAKRMRVSPSYQVSELVWPSACDYEAEYEYAINAGNENPGGDPTVITDGNILASVQAHWPPDPEVPPTE